MSKFYKKPELVVRKFDMHHSIFTDSGDKFDDDVYDITGLNPEGNNGMDVFGEGN